MKQSFTCRWCCEWSRLLSSQYRVSQLQEACIPLAIQYIRLLSGCKNVLICLGLCGTGSTRDSRAWRTYTCNSSGMPEEVGPPLSTQNTLQCSLMLADADFDPACKFR